LQQSIAHVALVVRDYDEVPGLFDLHRMATLLLAEHVPAGGRILVVGAGGGLELRAFAEARPGWFLDGVDPSPDMLRQAETALGDLVSRVAFHQGYVEGAPEGPFDGATCLLTLHFLPEAERRRTLAQIHRRLRPGSPFVAAHHSFPTEAQAADRWLSRNAAFAGTAPDQVESSIATMKERLPVLTPAMDEALLRDAGFTDVELFYAAFTFKGWVCPRA
jgi:tRNA (cmo5U34)-methyltransferase